MRLFWLISFRIVLIKDIFCLKFFFGNCYSLVDGHNTTKSSALLRCGDTIDDWIEAVGYHYFASEIIAGLACVAALACTEGGIASSCRWKRLAERYIIKDADTRLLAMEVNLVRFTVEVETERVPTFGRIVEVLHYGNHRVLPWQNWKVGHHGTERLTWPHKDFFCRIKGRNPLIFLHKKSLAHAQNK